MIPKEFEKVIEKIARENIQGNWFFVGSVGRELEGMPWNGVHKDIDIAADEKTLGKFRELFAKLGKRAKDSVLFEINGVTVEVCLKPSEYKFFRKIKTSNGLNTISLQDQIRRYEHAGNPEKASWIKKFLEKTKLKT